MYGSVIRKTVASSLFGELRDDWETPDSIEEAVTLASFVWHMEDARADSGDALFAWRAGETLSFATLGVLGEAVVASRTLGEALRRFAQGFPLVQTGTAVSVEVEDDEASVSYRILDPRLWPRRGDAELSVSLIRTMCLQYGVPPEALREVSFEHSPDRDPAALAGYLGLVPRFDRDENRITIPACLLGSRPGPEAAAGDAGPSMCWQTVQQGVVDQKRRAPVSDRVREQILRHLGRCAVAQGAVARELGMSERSLRRALAAEGTSFHDILEECRRVLGHALLTRTDRRFTDIALALGYSDQTAFSRAFSRWFGAPPSRIRAGCPTL